jgi:hypothetical protein
VSESELFKREPGLFEIAAAIAFLEPISRGVHLAGPRLHAERLVELWRAEGPVPLAQAFRLLNVSAVEGAIWQTMNAIGEFGNSRHWQFPEIEQLLPALRDLVWQEILAGRLVTEAITDKGRSCALVPAKLQFLEPDWPDSRLRREGRLEFASAEVKRPQPAAVPLRQASEAEIGRCIAKIVKEWPGAKPPEEDDLLKMVKAKLGAGVQRSRLRAAKKTNAPQWVLPRGRPSKKKSPK